QLILKANSESARLCQVGSGPQYQSCSERSSPESKSHALNMSHRARWDSRLARCHGRDERRRALSKTRGSVTSNETSTAAASTLLCRTITTSPLHGGHLGSINAQKCGVSFGRSGRI